jgi:hypothetical protein
MNDLIGLDLDLGLDLGLGKGDLAAIDALAVGAGRDLWAHCRLGGDGKALTD